MSSVNSRAAVVHIRKPVVMRTRGRSFRTDAQAAVDFWGSGETANGFTVRETIPPGPERARAVERTRAKLEEAAMSLQPAIEALRALISQYEPVELISSVAVPTLMGFQGAGRQVDDAAETVTWSAKIEYLVGLALSLPTAGTGSTPRDVTDRIMELISDVFDAAHAQQMVDALAQVRTGNDAFDMALFMLRLEHLYDRMPGYAVHIERIDAEVFDRHRGFYIESLGFNPADVTRVTRRRLAATGIRMNKAMQRGQRLIDRDPHGAALAIAEMLEEVEDSRHWEPESVAGDTGIDAAQVRAMLSFFSVPFGSQPDFRAPTDDNLARTHPCIDLGTGTYFVPDAWSLLSAVHPRLARGVTDAPSGPLQRYRRHREAGHQRLVTNTLRTVFGEDLVVQTQHYVSDTEGSGEIDTLVCVEWPVVVEAKAHGLTDSGRRGAPKRVATVAANVLDKALDQTRRARIYILDEGKRAFAATDGGQLIELLPPDLTGLTEIIVTFERMDPLAMQGPGVVGQQGRSVWTVGIADLLMVTDILNDAASFHQYARTRAATAAFGPVIFMESDGLGSYLIDRLERPRATALENLDAVVMIDYTSEAINAYFTDAELGHAARKPSTGLPTTVTDALADLARTTSGFWVKAVDEVLAAGPDAWKRWRSFARKHRSGRTFKLSDDLDLSIGPASLTTSGDGQRLELCVPLGKSKEVRRSSQSRRSRHGT